MAAKIRFGEACSRRHCSLPALGPFLVLDPRGGDVLPRHHGCPHSRCLMGSLPLACKASSGGGIDFSVNDFSS